MKWVFCLLVGLLVSCGGEQSCRQAEVMQSIVVDTTVQTVYINNNYYIFKNRQNPNDKRFLDYFMKQYENEEENLEAKEDSSANMASGKL